MTFVFLLLQLQTFPLAECRLVLPHILQGYRALFLLQLAERIVLFLQGVLKSICQ